MLTTHSPAASLSLNKTLKLWKLQKRECWASLVSSPPPSNKYVVGEGRLWRRRARRAAGAGAAAAANAETLSEVSGPILSHIAAHGSSDKYKAGAPALTRGPLRPKSVCARAGACRPLCGCSDNLGGWKLVMG